MIDLSELQKAIDTANTLISNVQKEAHVKETEAFAYAANEWVTNIAPDLAEIAKLLRSAHVRESSHYCVSLPLFDEGGERFGVFTLNLLLNTEALSPEPLASASFCLKYSNEGSGSSLTELVRDAFCNYFIHPERAKESFYRFIEEYETLYKPALCAAVQKKVTEVMLARAEEANRACEEASKGVERFCLDSRKN